ncbi:MAG: T9SS type A sorting domain-containing protein, partial [Bacteroidota bacterium]
LRGAEITGGLGSFAVYNNPVQFVEYLNDATLALVFPFGGPNLRIGNLEVTEPENVILTRTAELPFSVNLGPDIGQCQGTVTLDAGDEAVSYLWSTGETTQTIEVNISGTYSVEVTNEADESATDEVLVTIDEPIVFSLPETVNGVNQVELFGPSGDITYLWSTGETTQNIVVTNSGEYGLTVFTPNACESSSSTIVTIEGLAIFKGGAGDGFSVDQFIVTESFFEGGSGDGFSLNQQINTTSFYAGGLGDGYSISQLLQNESFFFGGIGDGHSVDQFVNNASFFSGGKGDGYANAELVNGMILAIENDQLPLQYELKIYPNPTAEFSRVTFEACSCKSQLIVFDLKGDRVLQIVVDNNETEKTLDVSGLKSGVYLVLLKRKDKKQFAKLIKR